MTENKLLEKVGAVNPTGKHRTHGKEQQKMNESETDLDINDTVEGTDDDMKTKEKGTSDIEAVRKTKLKEGKKKLLQDRLYQ